MSVGRVGAPVLALRRLAGRLPAAPAAGRRAAAAPASASSTSAVVRRMTCKVPDEAAVGELDAALGEAVRTIWPKVPGVVGISRAFCRTELDLEVSVEFADPAALDAFLRSDVMRSELYPHMKRCSHLYVGGIRGVRWQNLELQRLL